MVRYDKMQVKRSELHDKEKQQKKPPKQVRVRATDPDFMLKKKLKGLNFNKQCELSIPFSKTPSAIWKQLNFIIF